MAYVHLTHMNANFNHVGRMRVGKMYLLPADRAIQEMRIGILSRRSSSIWLCCRLRCSGAAILHAMQFALISSISWWFVCRCIMPDARDGTSFGAAPRAAAPFPLGGTR